MIIDQISVFAENRKGSLAEITELLADANIDLKAFTVADTTNFGVLRLLVDSPQNALDVLKQNDFIASITPVVSVKMDDKPGSLSKILRLFENAGIEVEYMYAFVAQVENTAYVNFRVENAEEAVEMLKKSGILD